MIRTIYFDADAGAVIILNQNRLPAQMEYEKMFSHQDLAQAIKLLKVRGAPLIGVTAAFALALAVINYTGSRDQLEAYYREAEQLLASTRPTAVNLCWAIKRMRIVFDAMQHLDIRSLAEELLHEAENMFDEDVAINNTIGEHGQVLLAPNTEVLTICNAGSLATCGYGTALGVIRSAHKVGKIKRVWACETRPVLQGARLTVWELMQDKIPVTLITDSMAAHLMSLGRVGAVVVGADRIAANGDTANKIGTYSLAVLARYHDLPFYVAAPWSTIDMSILSGQEIPIEERNQEEVRRVEGKYITVPEVKVFNPAFDVTPAVLISGIITQKGVILPPLGEGLTRQGQAL
ncbi:MAG: S-methyl-5-thioribose-1-phosphate isomerase [Firmicutes bacterium HGW-Firmicutes-15]|nr:MAG: S-methyl-5-thioribose-1-phosphate isomerase [Firmicutes bacterium HGW-Firmicutes-15]